MKPRQQPRPPRWATRFLSWYCRPELLEDLEGDLNEYFDRNVKSRGLRRARLIYIMDVLKFMRLYTVLIPSLSNSLISSIMIGSYIKTTRRNMVRNKLFSFINIFGLSISMSVGLLVIAFISDLHSYDNFHENRDRIYRVITEDERPEATMPLASTSVRAGKEISTSVPGVESVTLVRRGFRGDATVDEALIPIGGLWADQNFLQIFSFEMLEGDPVTALKAPYSIVLTEKTAAKLFGAAQALGKTVRVDSVDYMVSGVLKDLPKLSHLRFDALASFASVEQTNTSFLRWEEVYTDYVYVLLADGVTVTTVQRGVDNLCTAQNAQFNGFRLSLGLQSLNDIAMGRYLENSLGPSIPMSLIWVLSGLAFVVILSACFNYTNLSVARALRRSREVGIRKIVGAYKGQVMMQFILEAIVIAVLALAFSFVMFFFLRRQFLLLHFSIAEIASLTLSPRIVLYFLGLAFATGLLAGVVPALLFSRIQVVQALKDASSIRLFRAVNMRKSLIVVQYVFSLIFITTALIGYSQYKSFLAFDLGFKTENILNIKLQGGNSGQLADELLKSPMVTDVSRCVMLTSLGSIQTTSARHNDQDISVLQNVVDERYVLLHGHQLLVGRNFNWKADSVVENEVLVNEQLLKELDIAKGDPREALGEALVIDDRKLTIVGVLKDFHYSTVLRPIDPTVLRYQPNANYAYVNVKLQAEDLPAAMAWIEAAWKKVDSKHPLEARFYDDQIAQAYAMFSVMIRIIGFLAFLAVCIASVGLLGMIVFTTETKVKEVSIRKVLGASEGNLIVLLSRGFLALLLVAAFVALPVTYLFFDRVVLPLFAYHDPIHWIDMVAGFAGILVIASIMIGSQTLKVARTNPATVLKTE